MKPSFIHLHTHTEYSIVNGLLRVKPLVAAVNEQGMPAVAVTDQGNLFATIKFYKAAVAAGVKPLIGVEIWLHNEQQPDAPFSLVLLCQNNAGYANLTELVSQAYVQGQHLGRPIVQYDWLRAHAEGLIVLSGGRRGDVGQAILAGKLDDAKQCLLDWAELFPQRFYIELQRTGRAQEEEYIHAVVALAEELGIAVVATNDVHFLTQDDFDAHEARVCIHDGNALNDPRRKHLYSQQQYLRSPEDMAELFSDIPEALANTVEIAKRCNLELTLGKSFLPSFPVPEGIECMRPIESHLHHFLTTCRRGVLCHKQLWGSACRSGSCGTQHSNRIG